MKRLEAEPGGTDSALAPERVGLGSESERPQSFQTQAQAVPERRYFTETFAAGSPIWVDRVMDQGQGIYTLRLTYQDATGSLRVRVPPNSQL